MLVSPGPVLAEADRGALVVVCDPRRREERYLKRVVGLPGESISLRDGLLIVDDAHFPEPYLRGLPPSLGLEEGHWELGPGEYFVMGDNRAHSTDSRNFGAVHQRLIVGRAWLRVWPIGRWGRIT